MPYSHHPLLKRAVQMGRAVAYGMLTGAGGAILYVGDPPWPWRYMVLACFLLVGGLLSLVGQLADRWAGELMGLPLIASAMAAFGVLTVRDLGWTMISAPSILILMAIGVLFGMRWVDQCMLARSARLLARRGATTTTTEEPSHGSSGE